MPDLVRDLCALIEPGRALHSSEDLLAYGYDGAAAMKCACRARTSAGTPHQRGSRSSV